MCVYKDLPELSVVVVKPKSASASPRKRLKEPLKPKLSRKVIKSAKVNLNLYWTKFEQSINLTMDNEINENLANAISELGNK